MTYYLVKGHISFIVDINYQLDFLTPGNKHW